MASIYRLSKATAGVIVQQVSNAIQLQMTVIELLGGFRWKACSNKKTSQ